MLEGESERLSMVFIADEPTWVENHGLFRGEEVPW